MVKLDSKLTTSGNSVAVRLPKELLNMSGLNKEIHLEARRGQIIITNRNKSRSGWEEKIKSMVSSSGDPSDEFEGLEQVSSKLGELPWDGVSYKDWLESKKN